MGAWMGMGTREEGSGVWGLGCAPAANCQSVVHSAGQHTLLNTSHN